MMCERRQRTRFAAQALLTLLLARGIVAQQPDAADFTSQIDRLAQDELSRDQIPAASVAVGLNGRVVYSKAFGMADLENGVPATTESLIRTGSLAKPITAAAAMTLVEAGKLDLDAPAQRYCPAFPQIQWTITTRELLTHTSGIRHYKEGEIDNTNHYAAMSDGFSIFVNDPLLFEPGAKYSYSTYAYTVAGCVIEGASGQKYYDYLREHVLVPAGMTHTFVDDLYSIVPHRARGYRKVSGRVQNAGPIDSSYKIPGGGLVSTAEDYVRFASALMEGKIVSGDTLDQMWTPTGKPGIENGAPSTYGIGFGILTIGGEKYIAHSGGQQGTSTDMEIIPGRRFAVAVFENDESSEPFNIIRQILDLYHMPRPRPTK
jgi:serine beta-lactamase-like protein LACTB, mitochondrial